MAAKPQKYSPEFREEAAKMVVDGSRAIAQVAREYGLCETTLGNLVRAYREKHASDEPPLELSERGPASGIGTAQSGTGNGKRVPEKSGSVLREGASVSDKYAFIDAEYAAGCAPTIERMCRWMQVSKSGYYKWLHRPMSPTAHRRELLKIKIKALFRPPTAATDIGGCMPRCCAAANTSG
jgi:transposase-like protein